jgi:hypothetical protein
MEWNQGTKQITTHQNSAGTAINVLKCYSQINKVTLKASCERFCKAQFQKSGFVRVLIIKARYSLLQILHNITKSM